MEEVSRRKFLQVAGFLGSGLMLGIKLPGVANARSDDTEFRSLFLVVYPDNRAVFRLSKLEMGQGVGTGFMTIFAEEMGLDPSRVSVEHAPIEAAFGDIMQGVSGGSGSIQGGWTPLRTAAAQARELFLAAAGRKWSVPAGECRLAAGVVTHTPTGRQLTLGQLLTAVNATDAKQQDASLKDAAQYQYVGKPVRKVWGDEIVRGQLIYGMDFKLPGMHYASIERCPFFMGRAASFDASKARLVPGVVDVFKIDRIVGDAFSENNSPSYPYVVPEGIVVVATNSWAALQGRKALEITWEPGDLGRYSLAQELERQIGRAHETDEIVSDQVGDAEAAFAGGASLTHTFNIGFQAHAAMEPLAAVAHCPDDRCEIWIGHQFGKRIAEQASRTFGLAKEKVMVNILPAGGAFGRRWEADFALEAIYVAMKVRKPVKLFWTREDDIVHDYFHPFERHKHEVAIGAAGQIAAWRCKINTCDNMPGGFWNPYFAHVPHRKVGLSVLDSPLQVGAWRSVAHHRHVFSLESFVDRIARQQQKDPLQFRIAMLEDSVGHHHDKQAISRIINLLKYVAENGYWAGKPGQGIAVAQLRGSCVTVADVELKDQVWKINKITAFVDCGLAVNPSQVTAQIEGGIVWGLQAILHGGVQVHGGRVVQSNFHDYQMVRINDIPLIDVKLITSGHDVPLGVGELGVPGVAPAVANAILSLTNEAPSSIPFDPA